MLFIVFNKKYDIIIYMNIDVYKGNEKALLILTGIGGSTKGYKDKYVTIASQINQKIWCNGLCCCCGIWSVE